MRALVTGGAGFIGSTLVDRLLAEGHAVDVVDDLSTGSLANLASARIAATQGAELSVHQLDIRHPELVELAVRRSPDVIYHLAAQADVRVSVARPVFDAEVNVIGTLQVLEAARACSASKVVFAASGGTLYGDADLEELPVDERHERRPLSPYGVSKLTGLNYLAMYRELHQLEYVALALGNVYGPRQDPHGEAGVIAIFAGNLKAGAPCTIYGDGCQTRDFVFVDDVVDAFVRAGSRGSGLIANIGTGVPVSVNELYATMARVYGSDAAPRHVPARPGELRNNALDPGRASLYLGWQPWTSMEDGLRAVFTSIS